MVGISNIRTKIKSNNTIDTELVSIRLKEIRKSLKLTMRELAEKFNTTSSAISNYENNKFLILSSFLIELARYNNYSIDWILGRSNEKFIQQKITFFAFRKISKLGYFYLKRRGTFCKISQ